ncbi:hypothetical protein [Ligilactobacillus murinus]|uniref:hypothetical protein n=1 Tax=Ligilactobacillus murinus TaxID=1622 RepID=UPI00399D7182
MYYEQEDVLDYLLSICKKKHIKCFWPSSLDPHTPPTALPSKRRIVMNPNWHNQIAIPFQLAHEMAHILTVTILIGSDITKVHIVVNLN